MHRIDRKPVVKSGAKIPFANPLMQLPVGGRDNAYIDLVGLIGPEALDFAVL